MAVGRAFAGDEAQNLALIQLDGLGGSQIIRRQNHRFIRIDAAFHDAHQVVDDAAGYIADIRCASLHVGVIHGSEHSCKLLTCLLNGILGVAAFIIEHGVDALHIVFVLNEHGMGFKQDGGFIAGLSAALFSQGFQLSNRRLLRAEKTLLFSFGMFDVPAGNGVVLAAEEIHGTLYDALGDALTLHQNHGFPS